MQKRLAWHMQKRLLTSKFEGGKGQGGVQFPLLSRRLLRLKLAVILLSHCLFALCEFGVRTPAEPFCQTQSLSMPASLSRTAPRLVSSSPLPCGYGLCPAQSSQQFQLACWPFVQASEEPGTSPGDPNKCSLHSQSRPCGSRAVCFHLRADG